MAAVRTFLPNWGGKARRKAGPPTTRPKIKLKPKGLDYNKIKTEVMQAISELSAGKRAQISIGGTLPEIMLMLGLVWLGLPFQSQISEAGGRLRVGGATIDVLVYLGNRKIACRAMGAYWHSLPDRRSKDLVQLNILRMKKYLVADFQENDLYLAWNEGRLRTLISDGIMGAS
jgi:hypothetical protein